MKNRKNSTSSTKKALTKGLGCDNIYFIGIGGIGMSALALYFKATNISVAGYDKTKTNITDNLANKGIDIHFEDGIVNIDDRYLNPETTLIIYTPAIPDNHKELTYLLMEKQRLRVYSDIF